MRTLSLLLAVTLSFSAFLLADDDPAAQIAAEVEQAYQEAQKAIENCDREAYEKAIQKLNDLRSKAVKLAEKAGEQLEIDKMVPGETTVERTSTISPEDAKALGSTAPRDSRDAIRDEFKGTCQIASVAERLVNEGSITYDQSTPQDFLEKAEELGYDKNSPEARAAAEAIAQRYTVYAKPENIPYTDRGSCFEFVHLAAWFCGKAEGQLYSVGNTIGSAIDPNTLQKWDFESEIPAGKVIVSTLPGKKTSFGLFDMGGQGSEGTFHFGVSLGNGMVASNHGAGPQIEKLDDVFGKWSYWMFGAVYYGDYKRTQPNNDTSAGCGTVTDPDEQLEIMLGGVNAAGLAEILQTANVLTSQIDAKIKSLQPPNWEDCERPKTQERKDTASVIGATGQPAATCTSCPDLPQKLADAVKELADLENQLKNITSQLDFYDKARDTTTQQLQDAQNTFNKHLKTEVSARDTETGTNYYGHYTDDGQGETIITHPDGKKETRTWNSRYMSMLKEHIDQLNQRLEDINKSVSDLEKKKSDLESQITKKKQEVDQLVQAYRNCPCLARKITVVFDRSDCKFGGGSVIVPIRGDFILDAGSQPVDAPPVGGTVPTPGTPGAKPDTPLDAPAPGATPTPDKPATPSPTSRGDRPGDRSRDLVTRGQPIPVPVPIPTPGTKEKPPEEKPPATPPEAPPPPTVIIIVKATETVLKEGATSTQSVPETLMKIPGVEPPLTADNPDVGFDEEPNYPEKRPDGTLVFKVTTTPAATQTPGDFTIEEALNLDLSAQGGDVLGFVYEPEKPQDQYVDSSLTPYVKHNFRVGDTMIVVLQYPVQLAERVASLIQSTGGLQFSEPNFCRIILRSPNDPYYLSKSSWKQGYDDQWAIKRVGLTADANSPWNIKETSAPVVVAVVDTGLDWNHQDISWQNLWQNSREIPENGVDDDKNGYIDDIIGYDFYRRNNMPWDQSGHGTFVAGIIGASHNGKGIAGINPAAKIMALKALNSFGHTRASYLAEAITYAANNGARVINVSVGGPNLTRVEQLAINYAYSKGAVVVVAAGNEASDITNYSPAGLQNVLTVSASNIQDKRSAYSNWGAAIDIAAPGDDVLSLRARRTDLMRDVTGVKYTAGQAYVGVDKRYYRASGTSFAAPIVAGTASLLFSIHPELTNQEVERMIVQSAKDMDVAGRDQHTGYGLVDAKAAIAADPAFFINVEISGVKVVTEGSEAKVQVTGSAEADRFNSSHLEIGAGKAPAQWKRVSADLTSSLRNGVLGAIAASEFKGAADWTIRVIAEHQSGKSREAWFYLKLQ